jgi:DNA-binding beta-propeller fold protein YncE
VRNVYYASVPASVPDNGNRIATIDPTTGQVSYSAPVGSDPNVLALAADASVLYVGLDGSSDLVKLALPGMTELGRAKLTGASSQLYAESIAVSPADPAVAAVSVASRAMIPGQVGVVLLRDMVTQPKTHHGSSLVTFDSAGTTLYGLNIETTEFGLRRIQVLADGLVEDLLIVDAVDGVAQAFGFAGGRVIAGHVLYDAPGLTKAGTVSSPSDCRPQRSGSLLLCFNVSDYNTGPGRILLADSGTFVIGASLAYTASEPGGPRRLVEGPTGQIAISYPVNTSGLVSKIRLFTSVQLMTPPAPAAPSWPVTAFLTVDGQALDVAITHNSLVYDSSRNVYYASVPGSVIGAGNSIAAIDPATGQVMHSAPVGSEPNALAIAANGSVLYVGLDGSGEVERLALPSMTPQGRTRLVVDPVFGQARANRIAVSPADPAVAAVSMDWLLGTHAGVALLRDMVMQPRRTQAYVGGNLVAFDSAGTTLYGLNSESTEYGLRRVQVLADGLLEDLVVVGATRFAPRIGRVLVADSGTFVIGASLQYAPAEPNPPRSLVQGPADQVAISYTAPFASFTTFATPTIRLFSSAQLP